MQTKTTPLIASGVVAFSGGAALCLAFREAGTAISLAVVCFVLISVQKIRKSKKHSKTDAN